LMRVSVHEAGHFVVGRAFGFETTEMHLSERGDGYSGFVKFTPSRFEDILNAERTGRTLEDIRAQWGVSVQEFERLHGICTQARRSLVMKLMMRALAGVAADTELGGGNGTMGEGDYEKARELAHAIVPEALVDTLMKKVLNDARKEATGSLRVAILTVAERLRRRRHFDAKALASLWHEVSPEPGYEPGMLG
jgi:hypothetical protein